MIQNYCSMVSWLMIMTNRGVELNRHWLIASLPLILLLHLAPVPADLSYKLSTNYAIPLSMAPTLWTFSLQPATERRSICQCTTATPVTLESKMPAKLEFNFNFNQVTQSVTHPHQPVDSCCWSSPQGQAGTHL